MNENLVSEPARPEVTVVIPTFNRGAVVGRAIGSVLAQTCQDWELIVVDDCSTDGTEQVVKGFSDDRIKYIRHDRNRRGGAARNTGIRCARGKYVAFLDDDDEWLPEKLEKELEFFRHSDPEVGLVYSGMIISDEHGNVLVSRLEMRSGWVHEALLDHNFIGSCSRVTVKKEILDRVAGFDESFVNCQDYDLWLRVAKVSKVACVPHYLVRRYLVPERMTASLRNIGLGWEQILIKYRSEMKPPILVRHLSRLALLLFNYEPRRARALAWEGLGLRPFQPKLMIALALSTLGRGCYRRAYTKLIKSRHKFYVGRAKI
jgi:glycosyltransferase involved in cell wall biosynthesis